MAPEILSFAILILSPCCSPPIGAMTGGKFNFSLGMVITIGSGSLFLCLCLCLSLCFSLCSLCFFFFFFCSDLEECSSVLGGTGSKVLTSGFSSLTVATLEASKGAGGGGTPTVGTAPCGGAGGATTVGLGGVGGGGVGAGVGRDAITFGLTLVSKAKVSGRLREEDKSILPGVGGLVDSVGGVLFSGLNIDLSTFMGGGAGVGGGGEMGAGSGGSGLGGTILGSMYFL